MFNKKMGFRFKDPALKNTKLPQRTTGLTIHNISEWRHSIMTHYIKGRVPVSCRYEFGTQFFINREHSPMFEFGEIIRFNIQSLHGITVDDIMNRLHSK